MACIVGFVMIGNEGGGISFVYGKERAGESGVWWAGWEGIHYSFLFIIRGSGQTRKGQVRV